MRKKYIVIAGVRQFGLCFPKPGRYIKLEKKKVQTDYNQDHS